MSSGIETPRIWIYLRVVHRRVLEEFDDLVLWHLVAIMEAEWLQRDAVYDGGEKAMHAHGLYEEAFQQGKLRKIGFRLV